MRAEEGTDADRNWFVRLREYQTSRFERASVRPEGATER